MNIPDEGRVDASQAELGREKPSEEHGVTSVKGECTGGVPSPAQVYSNDKIGFNAIGDDVLRNPGFSKDGKTSESQIVLGLLLITLTTFNRRTAHS